MMLPPFIRRQLSWPDCLPVFLSLYAPTLGLSSNYWIEQGCKLRILLKIPSCENYISELLVKLSGKECPHHVFNVNNSGLLLEEVELNSHPLIIYVHWGSISVVLGLSKCNITVCLYVQKWRKYINIEVYASSIFMWTNRANTLQHRTYFLGAQKLIRKIVCINFVQ